MNKLLDLVFGVPGTIIFTIIMIVGIVTSSLNDVTKREVCIASGGHLIQTMNLYTTCKPDNIKFLDSK